MGPAVIGGGPFFFPRSLRSLKKVLSAVVILASLVFSAVDLRHSQVGRIQG
jgi:hypothetical protein